MRQHFILYVFFHQSFLSHTNRDVIIIFRYMKWQKFEGTTAKPPMKLVKYFKFQLHCSGVNMCRINYMHSEGSFTVHKKQRQPEVGAASTSYEFVIHTLFHRIMLQYMLYASIFYCCSKSLLLLLVSTRIKGCFSLTVRLSIRSL